MDIYLSLSGITFHLAFERDISVNPQYAPFLIPPRETVDITVRVTWDWGAVPQLDGTPIGRDLLHQYYMVGGHLLCVTLGGPKGPVGCTVCSPDFRELVCYVNEAPFLCKLQALGSFLRMIPICRIFTHFGTLFFHAAQILYTGKGILFSAPSGTGKTTQARLWQTCRGAELLCNDRTLVRKMDGKWQTFGFPLDGSVPVANNRVCSLGAVVCLEQGETCFAERLPPSKALSRLMPQMVIDGWDEKIRSACMRQLVAMMEAAPVYRLVCTPDVHAVETLEQQLLKG